MASSSAPSPTDHSAAETDRRHTSQQTTKQPCRLSALRFCLPGTDSGEGRLKPETAYPLTQLFIRGLKAPHVDALELTTISGNQQQEYFLTPLLRSATETALEVPIQTTVTDYHDQNGTVPNTTMDALAGIATATLPTDLGIELCDVDLAAIGSLPVTTCRLLFEENGALRQPHFDVLDPFVETVTTLAGTGHPFLVQVIVERGSGEKRYIVTLRYAILEAAYGIESARAVNRHLEAGIQFGIEEIWHAAGLTTNYDLPIREFALPGSTAATEGWDIGRKPILQRRRYMEKSDSETAIDLYTGRSEYDALFQGRAHAPKLYERLGLYPRIPVMEYTLRLFGSLVPVYYEASPWTDVFGRWAPDITTRRVVQEASGFPHKLGTGTDSTVDTRASGTMVTSGSGGHDQLLAFAVEYFTSEGEDAWIEPQDGRSLPDGGHVTADGTLRAIEVEFSGLSKPANPLTNYARAAHTGHPVDFVVENERKARRLYDRLRTPWKDVTDHGTHLHNLTTAVELSNGQWPVLPAKASESLWYLDASGEVTLRDTAGTVLASGPAEDSVCTFAYDTPRYDTSDGTHRIVAPDGVTEATYENRTQVLDEWTLVHAPFVPGALHYLTDVDIYYQSGDTLAAFDMQADWDRTADSATARFECGIEEFIETYTCEEAGESLPYATFQAAVTALFEARSQHSPPNKTHIGINLPDELEVDKSNRSDRYVHDRTLLYPPGLVSPDLPFMEPDEDREGRTEDA